MLNRMELCLAVGIGTKDSQRIKQEPKLLLWVHFQDNLFRSQH